MRRNKWLGQQSLMHESKSVVDLIRVLMECMFCSALSWKSIQVTEMAEGLTMMDCAFSSALACPPIQMAEMAAWLSMRVRLFGGKMILSTQRTCHRCWRRNSKMQRAQVECANAPAGHHSCTSRSMPMSFQNGNLSLFHTLCAGKFRSFCSRMTSQTFCMLSAKV